MGELRRPLRFVQMITGTMWVNPAVPTVQTSGMWIVLYALADDGTVWWWSGGGWTQCGPQPDVEA